MHKREMRHIQEIFDRSRPAGMIFIGAAVDFVESRVVPLRKERNILLRAAQRDPDPVVALLRLVDFYLCPGRRLLLWMSRNTYALSFLIIGPAMVGTNQGLVFDFAQREPRAPVQAEVAPYVNLCANTPQNQILVQQTHSHRLAFYQI